MSVGGGKNIRGTERQLREDDIRTALPTVVLIGLSTASRNKRRIYLATNLGGGRGSAKWINGLIVVAALGAMAYLVWSGGHKSGGASGGGPGSGGSATVSYISGRSTKKWAEQAAN